MTARLAALGDNATEINVSDLLPEEGEPADFYKSVLDDVNAEARFYGWRGVTFERVRYSKDTRVFSVSVSRGAAPATLHLMRAHIAATSRTGEMEA